MVTFILTFRHSSLSSLSSHNCTHFADINAQYKNNSKLIKFEKYKIKHFKKTKLNLFSIKKWIIKRSLIIHVNNPLKNIPPPQQNKASERQLKASVDHE